MANYKNIDLDLRPAPWEQIYMAYVLMDSFFRLCPLVHDASHCKSQPYMDEWLPGWSDIYTGYLKAITVLLADTDEALYQMWLDGMCTGAYHKLQKIVFEYRMAQRKRQQQECSDRKKRDK